MTTLQNVKAPTHYVHTVFFVDQGPKEYGSVRFSHGVASCKEHLDSKETDYIPLWRIASVESRPR